MRTRDTEMRDEIVGALHTVLEAARAYLEAPSLRPEDRRAAEPLPHEICVLIDRLFPHAIRNRLREAASELTKPIHATARDPLGQGSPTEGARLAADALAEIKRLDALMAPGSMTPIRRCRRCSAWGTVPNFGKSAP